MGLEIKEFIIKYWLAAAFGVVATGLGLCYKGLSKKVHQQLCDQKSLKDGTKALLRNEIIRSYEKYVDLKWMPLYARENVLEMYNSYHNLGGNGAVTKLIEELMALSSAPPKEGD